jgi:hypothetical protein
LFRAISSGGWPVVFIAWSNSMSEPTFTQEESAKPGWIFLISASVFPSSPR